MKMTTIRPRLVELPERYAALDDRGVSNYYWAGHGRYFLGKAVINPFEEALKEETGYSDSKIPRGKKEDIIPVGDIEFHVTTTPTKKRPPLEAVYNHLDSFLDRVSADYAEGRAREGVRTLDSEPYISAMQVLNEIAGKRDEVISEGVRQSIEKALPAYLRDEELKSVLVSVGSNYGRLTPDSAKTYVRSERAVELYSGIIGDFECNLRGLTGYAKGNTPEDTEEMWEQVGSHLFLMQTIPYDSTSYGKIVDALAKEGKKESGDLVRISRNQWDGLDAYRPKTREGEAFISLEGLKGRLGELKGKHTERAIRQPIFHFPLPE
ncbi:MAG: hypothetical protein HY367_04515 [Candidatus Aenigmarchaeota archaeon]|nr:hypothetical protein [Candidatus Aenigmarchaeota archaeon]